MKRTIAMCLGLMLVAGLTVKSAGAMTALDWYGQNAGSADSPFSGGDNNGGPVCGAGSRTVCKTMTVSTCTEWQSTGGTIGASATGGTVGATWACKTTITTVEYLYFP